MTDAQRIMEEAQALVRRARALLKRSKHASDALLRQDLTHVTKGNKNMRAMGLRSLRYRLREGAGT